MLDDLVGVIAKLQGRIRDHGDVLRQNEIRTRVALIDPLLQALGWDVANPGLAIPEYEIGGQRVDYALLGTDGKPAATVEAKKLGENLAASRMQMLNYSNAAGIAYAGLTDGNQWELYEVFKQVTLEERRLLDLRILDTPAHECALKLLLLWQPNLATGRPVAAGEPIFSNTENVPPPPNPGPIPPPGPEWVSLSDFQPTAGNPHPPTIRLPGGAENDLTSWRSIPLAVAEYLVATGRLTAANCPVPVPGGVRYVVHREAVHSQGQGFANSHPLSNGLFCEANVSQATAVSYAKTLLQHCGLDAGAVWLRLNP